MRSMNDRCGSAVAPHHFVAGKKWTWRIVCFFLVVTVIFFLGPRVQVDSSIRPIDSSLLEDLDTYLTKGETPYSPMPGTEKKVEWRYLDHRKTKYSLVYIHGFSASRQECMPVPTELADRLNANLFATRLTAHGCDAEAFAKVQVNDWLNDVHEGVAIGKKLGDHVVLVGMSTGATLALWMANQDPEISAVVLMSPNFGVPNKNAAYALYPWGQQIINVIQGPYTGFTAKNELHEHYWTTHYRTEGVVQMLALIDYCRRQDYRRLQVPCLCIYSENDPILDTSKIVAELEEVGSDKKKVIVWSGSDRHVLAGDILSPETNQRLITDIMRFLESILASGDSDNRPDG